MKEYFPALILLAKVIVSIPIIAANVVMVFEGQPAWAVAYFLLLLFVLGSYSEKKSDES